MFEYLVIAGLGAWFAGRGRPSTKVEKSKAYGRASGLTWDSESYPELGRLVVMARGTRVVFERDGERLRAIAATGDPKIVLLMRRDFEG